MENDKCDRCGICYPTTRKYRDGKKMICTYCFWKKQHSKKAREYKCTKCGSTCNYYSLEPRRYVCAAYEKPIHGKDSEWFCGRCVEGILESWSSTNK